MKKKINLLNCCPYKKSYFSWSRQEGGKVVIQITKTGFYNKIAQMLFHRPKICYIELDRYGSFIWEHIDGTFTIEQIIDRAYNTFGEEIEPALERAVLFFKVLYNNQLISIKN